MLRIPVLFSMPGGGSGAPDIIRLYDENGNLLHETTVDMVQMVQPNRIFWEDDKVCLPLIAKWQLPQQAGTQGE